MKSQLLMVALVVGFCALFSMTESCSMAIEDPCQHVGCRSGTTCQQDSSYYCEDRVGQICTPVAVCVKSPKDVQDPCLNFPCPDGSACVKVPNHCEGKKPCRFIARCKVTHRPGQCPKPENNTLISDCNNNCQGTDEMCEKNYKCCRSLANDNKSFCVPPIL